LRHEFASTLWRLPRLAITTLLLILAAAPAAEARDDSLARTPPMGWNSWYAYRCSPTQEQILANARAMVDSGMAAAGYEYVNVDGCWQAVERDADGNLQADPETFPDGMAALAEQVHEMGLKFGLYTSAGETICLHPHDGSYRNYVRDFRTFARWKVDYVKVDWCSPAPEQTLRTSYRRVARAAAKADRRMIVTVSTPGISEPWKWGAPYGNSWRIAPDLNGSWEDLLRVLDVAAPLWRHGEPSGWNDADILQVGNGQLTDVEGRAHFSLWSIIASPLLAGNRLPEMSAETREILTNREVIRVNQHPRGIPGRRVRRRDGREVWVKPLRGGCRALLALNRTAAERTMRVNLRRLRWVPRARRYTVRDLWEHSTGDSGGRLRLTVPSHGVRMLKVCPR
jgi:alpha-galactosidase